MCGLRDRVGVLGRMALVPLAGCNLVSGIDQLQEVPCIQACADSAAPTPDGNAATMTPPDTASDVGAASPETRFVADAAPESGATSGSATSGTSAAGGATSGTASTGTASSGSATGGAAASGGTASSGSATSGVATSGTTTSGTAASGSAASGAASSGNSGLTVVARLALNGPDYTGVDYPGFWKGWPVSTTCGPYGYGTSQPLHGTNDAPLFRNEINGNPVTCTIGAALAVGSYRVRLYFAEIVFGPGCSAQGGVGSRVFDIVLEGTTVLRNFDIFAESEGCLASTTSNSGVPVVKTFDVTVSDGTLDISLPATHNRAKISALEVFGPL
jgi:hypothetical protein